MISSANHEVTARFQSVLLSAASFHFSSEPLQPSSTPSPPAHQIHAADAFASSPQSSQCDIMGFVCHVNAF